MVQVTAKIEPKSLTELQEAFKQFVSECRKDTRDAAIQQLGLACGDAIVLTPPVIGKSGGHSKGSRSGGKGNTKESQKWGEGAVEQDIKSFSVAADGKGFAKFLLFRRLGDACFRNDRSAFDSVMKSPGIKGIRNNIFVKIANDPNHERAFKKAKNLFGKFIPSGSETSSYKPINKQTLKSVHNSLKQRFNGRIRANGGPRINWINKYVVESKAVLDEYIKERQLQVGKLKSGWLSAMRKLPKGRYNKSGNYKIGDSNTPISYVARHAGPGYARVSDTDQLVSAVVGNMIGDNNNVATDADVPNIIYGLRVKKMRQDIEQMLERNARKFNKQ